MKVSRSIITLTAVCLLASTSSPASAQNGMAGMDHSKHRMGPEIVIPPGALYTISDVKSVYEGRPGAIATRPGAFDWLVPRRR